MTAIVRNSHKISFSPGLGRRLGIAALILFVSFLGFLAWLFITTRSPYGTTASLEPVPIEIAGRHFAIPKAYIWYRPAWKGGKMDGVNMHALLPDFKPYSQETKAEFERLGHGNKIGFLLEYSPHQLSRAQFFERRYPADSIKRAKNGPFGFHMFQLPPKGFVGEEIYYRYLEDGSFFFLECSTNKKHKSPGCSGSTSLGDGFFVDYSYSRDYLKDWQQIEQGLRDLIYRFEVTPASIAPTQK